MQAVYIIWLRELKKYWRNKSRIIGSLGMPFMLLFVMGSGLNNVIEHPAMQGNYTAFIMPGIIGMVLLFSSIFSGVSVIWDKQFGFMKEMLVAPITRTKIIFGKVLGGATTSMIQALIMLTIAFLLGVRFKTVSGLIFALPVMFLISSSFVAIGTAIASKMKDMQGFQLIVNFMIMPIFFLSGALFPLDGLPSWLRFITNINPMTYGVEALRFFLLGIESINPIISVTVLLAFFTICMTVATIFFKNMEV